MNRTSPESLIQTPPTSPTERAAQALEWPRFLELASSQALTEKARDAILDLVDSTIWARDPESARHLQTETQEALAVLEREGLWGPLSGLADPEPSLDRLARGAVLEVSELALIRRWLLAVDAWTQAPHEEITGDHLRKALEGLPDVLRPLRLLDRVLTPDGELSERASPRLAQLHAEIRTLKREISSTLDHLVKSLSQKGVLQESFSDVRDGRYVLPVRISAQNEVEGIIYEASASRQTVFVEPQEVAPLNNRLRARQNELIQEVYRVLMETSDELRPFGAQINAATLVLSHWDAVQARARHGRQYNGKPVIVAQGRSFRMHQTAHPLLWWSLAPGDIIRNEVDFGSPASALLLTGPNTGGKTVLLKTLGLAALCARTGFPFPGNDSPEVPFFDSVFADLGDPQSIEQHLSSFSGHLMRFREILENVTERALVLLDELNSATDPEEGAALGRAFMETVLDRGAMVVTTTHDPHLKAIALTDPRILNASMQFDEGSRTPTYRIALGVPGRSRALETAERLGIPRKVVELARTYLSREHVEFETVLSKLENDAREATRAREEAEALRREAAKLEAEWRDRTERSVGEMLDRTRQKLKRVVETAQEEVRTTARRLEELKARKEADDAKVRLIETLAAANELVDSALKEEAPEVAETLERARREKEKPRPSAATAAGMETGAKVRVPKWKSTGTVLSVQGDKVKVALGNLQMTLGLAEIELVAPPKSPAQRTHVSTSASAQAEELDMRGMRYDEAMSALEAYLDAAYRSGVNVEVRVIHGFGTGALREGTRKLLSRLPYVREFRDAPSNQGGAGATVIELNR